MKYVLIAISLSLIPFVSNGQKIYYIKPHNFDKELNATSSLIEINHYNGRKTTGTGFFYTEKKKGIFFITAFHVFEGSELRDTAKITFYSKNPYTDTSKSMLKISLRIFKSNDFRVDKDNDIIAFRIAKYYSKDSSYISVNKLLNVINKQPIPSLQKDFISKFNSVIVGNDCYLFGYPKSLRLKNLDQYNFDLPLLRKGIIAGKYPRKGRIIIDCPSYPGNSGGPVFEYSSSKGYKLIGIVDAFIPFEQKFININFKNSFTEISNSGYSIVIPITFALKLINKF